MMIFVGIGDRTYFMCSQEIKHAPYSLNCNFASFLPLTSSSMIRDLIPDFLIDIFVEFKEYGVRNWDGEDAEPIVEETIRSARILHGALPRTALLPDIAPGADGTVAFQWRNGPWDRPSFVIIEVKHTTISARQIDEYGHVSHFPPLVSDDSAGIEYLVGVLFSRREGSVE